MKRIFLALVLTGSLAAIPSLTGCDREVQHTESQQVNPNGTVTTNDQSTKVDPNGNTVTESNSSTSPKPQP